jgi:hypothetical protein
MRLLNTTSLEVEEQNPRSIPMYAILSHTWEEEEVTLQDMESLHHRRARSKAGYSKLVNSCGEARRLGYRWIWIDTCCIDKTSSAELSEAINSMFKWYQKARVCLAYLSDVSNPPCKCSIEDKGFMMECICGFESAFCQSRWFTRGWTLQELIAPGQIIFYSSEWEELGTKESLRIEIHLITGIDMSVLIEECGPQSIEARLRNVSAADKMSWLSKRNTTREEDIAYCLLGIFDVNMSLLYGEGEEKAFLRLQMEIFEMTEDYSLLAWKCPLSDFRTWSGLFAAKPAAFADGIDTRSAANLAKQEHELRPSVTKRGVHLPVQLILRLPIEPSSPPYDLHMAVLANCEVGESAAIPILWLWKCGKNEYVRATLSPTAVSEEMWLGKLPLTCNE